MGAFSLVRGRRCPHPTHPASPLPSRVSEPGNSPGVTQKSQSLAPPLLIITVGRGGGKRAAVGGAGSGPGGPAAQLPHAPATLPGPLPCLWGL